MTKVRALRALLFAVTLLMATAFDASAVSGQSSPGPQNLDVRPNACSGGSALSGWYGMLVGGSGKFVSGALFFDGNCNVTGTNITGGFGHYSTTSVTGTYSPTADGTGTYNLNLTYLSPASTETYIIGISQSGKKARGIESDGSLEATIDLQSQMTSLTSGYNTGSLTGVYAASCSAALATDLNYLTFDGNGNVSVVDYFDHGSGVGSNTLVGTYSVNGDGTFAGSLVGSYSFNGVIEKGVTEIEYTYASAGAGALACAGKQSQAVPPALTGRYGLVVGEPTHGTEGGEYFSGSLNFSAGTLSGTVNGDLSDGSSGLGSSTVTGTYVTNADNTVSLTLNLATPAKTLKFIVGVSEGANGAAGIQTDGSVVASIDLQKQLQPPPSFGVGSIIGTYAASCSGYEIDLNYTTFDGNGNIIAPTQDAYDNGGYGDLAYAGTYTVNSDGTFSAHFSGINANIFNVFTLSGVLDNGSAEMEFSYDQSGIGGMVSCIGESTYGATNTNPVAATPAFSPAPGIYNASQTVALSDTTSGATIYYTTNGVAPTAESQVYSAPIALTSTSTIQAIAAVSGDNNSAIAAGTYFLMAATPTFSPTAGSYSSIQSVTLSDASSNAVIYYTTDGSTPTTSSSVYSTPIQVSATTTIKALAAASPLSNSAVASALYTINLPAAATPIFSPAAGIYTSAQSVTLSDATSGAVIYYTTNGTTPTTSSSVYSTPIPVSATTTIEAIAVATGYNNSAVASATYTINMPAAATPTFSPVAGTYTSAQSVTISDSTSGAVIYYTTDGSTPTTSSLVYSTPIAVNATTTIQAIAVAAGFSNSSLASGVFTINLPTVATPSLSPTPGSYSPSVAVTLSDSTSGAVIYYTVNGSAPTTSSLVYSSPIQVNSTTTINAIAVLSGYNNSVVASGTYSIAGSGIGSFNLVQHVNNASCPAGTTCAIPLSQSIAAGDLLVFEGSSASGPSMITATDNGGALVQCVSCMGFDATSLYSGTFGGWILSASAEASQITLTFTGNQGAEVEMWEYSYTGGTPGFDGANQTETKNSANPTATAFTASGSNGISVQACRASQQCNSVTTPFVGDNLGGYYAWSALSTPAVWNAPTWTLASSRHFPAHANGVRFRRHALRQQRIRGLRRPQRQHHQPGANRFRHPRMARRRMEHQRQQRRPDLPNLRLANLAEPHRQTLRWHQLHRHQHHGIAILDGGSQHLSANQRHQRNADFGHRLRRRLVELQPSGNEHHRNRRYRHLWHRRRLCAAQGVWPERPALRGTRMRLGGKRHQCVSGAFDVVLG